jgi:hypothetical protein
MDRDEDREALKRLFLGAIEPDDIPIGIAVTRAHALLLHRWVEAARGAFELVEEALPNEREHPGGQINVSEYNQRIMSIIRAKRAELDAFESDVDSLIGEMDATETQ